MLHMHAQEGYIDRWPQGNGPTGCMVGDSPAIVIAESYLKGVTGFDAAYACQALRDYGTLDNAGTHREQLSEYLEYGYYPPKALPRTAPSASLAFRPIEELSRVRLDILEAIRCYPPDTIVVDYCSGGGGKTLALAMLALPEADPARVTAPSPAGWSPTGADELAAAKSASPAAPMRLIACDVVQKRLDNIRPRLARAGVAADLRLIGQNGGGVEEFNGRADLVFVDAPCSGSGAWRRRLSSHPSLRFPAERRQIHVDAVACQDLALVLRGIDHPHQGLFLLERCGPGPAIPLDRRPFDLPAQPLFQP